MIEDINYSQYSKSEKQYYNTFKNPIPSNIYVGVDSVRGPGIYVFTSLYIALNKEHDIEFSHNPRLSHHP